MIILVTGPVLPQTGVVYIYEVQFYNPCLNFGLYFLYIRNIDFRAPPLPGSTQFDSRSPLLALIEQL